MVRGNTITVLGGYFLALGHPFKPLLLLSTLLGMALIMAASCVFNNYIDRDIDRLMMRTRHRVLAQRHLAEHSAICYGLFLGLLGFSILYIQTNLLTVAVAFVGFFVYVFCYSLWLKRRSTWSTAIGAIAGAMPPLAGYCAVSNQLDMGAMLLFLLLFFWQIPHFYLISIYRLKDFTAASIPILPLKKSVHYTKISILVYIVVFTLISVLPSVFAYVGIVYFSGALGLGLLWLLLGIKGFNRQSDQVWSRKMFLFSILNITLLCAIMPIKY